MDFRSVPDGGRFYAFWPFEIQDLQARAQVTPKRRLKISGRVVTSAPVAGEKLVVALRAFGPGGSEQRAYRRTVDCEAGAFSTTLPGSDIDRRCPGKRGLDQTAR